MAHIQGTWRAPRRTLFGYLDSARRTVKAQRVAPGTEAALEILKKVLPAPDYDRMESEWRNGLREIRLEDGFIITCLTPAQ
jgi:hypothetical protein